MGDHLKGKVAIIIGAGSIGPGIGNGKASAVVYSREGARVVLVDHNLEAAEETKCLIDKEGGDCITCQADVTKASNCEYMVDQCIQTFGRVDILHNNVGIVEPGGPVETSEESWDRVMNWKGLRRRRWPPGLVSAWWLICGGNLWKIISGRC